MFDFLNRIKTTLNNLWGPMSGAVQKSDAKPLQVSSQPQTQNNQKVISPLADNPMPVDQSSPEIQGQIAKGMNQITPEQILAALIKFGGGKAPPVSSAANELALLGNELSRINPQIPPAFPAALALRESGGGQNIPPESNNPYGIRSDAQSFATYPDFGTATIGGGPQNQQGLRGTLMGDNYKPFLQSGNMNDFFNVYSPPSENASTADQIAQFMQLLQYFQR